MSHAKLATGSMFKDKKLLWLSHISLSNKGLVFATHYCIWRRSPQYGRWWVCTVVATTRTFVCFLLRQSVRVSLGYIYRGIVHDFNLIWLDWIELETEQNDTRRT